MGEFISLSGRELRGGLRHVREFISVTAIYLRLAAKLAAAVLTGRIIAPLIFKLAARNLFHDRLRFAATITGIVFSMVLVSVQMGLFVSFRMVRSCERRARCSPRLAASRRRRN